MLRKSINEFDKNGLELFVGDEVLLINWNDNAPKAYQDEKRIIFEHKEDGFCVMDSQYDTGCWCSVQMINFDLCVKVEKK